MLIFKFIIKRSDSIIYISIINYIKIRMCLKSHAVGHITIAETLWPGSKPLPTYYRFFPAIQIIMLIAFN